MLRAALEAQAPPKQSLEAAINTVSSRLANATLLEDRRSAILGLRSFAEDYPATVASKALRELISTLSKDVADVDTGKVVLETLLKIVNPKPDSPEASDQIALWIADQFTQRQDNITLLLKLLENDDFYSRVYSLQLLQAVSESRPERTQECILSAPLGIARLVGILDDRREAVQSAGVLLLNEITEGSFELQKVVAFENAFERLFHLIRSDGALSGGREMVEDCMNLLAKLLNLNASNQSLFRESGCVGQLAELFVEDARDRGSAPEDDPVSSLTREKNTWGLLTLLRMFLIEGNPGCKSNQVAFEKQGLLQLVLDLAFSEDMGPPLRAEALRTCADIIKGNSQIQERFAYNQVKQASSHQADGVDHDQVNGDARVYIIDALLDIALSTPTVALFDLRYAASECIQAYFYNHTPIRRHFLQRAIDGHTSGEDETSNVMTILIQGSRSEGATDSYRAWFAAELCQQLIFDDAEAKDMVKAISEGDADKGEEVVTCVQAVTGNLVEALQAEDNDRVLAAYFMVLCVWLFDDADAVNDLLTEGSTVQSLVRSCSSDGRGKELSQGLSAFLLGILYEFSSKDSPIPRRKLQPLLISSLGREHYIAKITRLRESSLMRDFEVTPQNLTSAEPGALPEVYFDQLFVNFLKDNFSRLVRAIDRDPGIEVARVTEGVDRDLVDSLQSQIKDKSEALDKSQAELLDLKGKIGQEQADSRRSQETFNAELARIKNINESLQQGHDQDTEDLKKSHNADRQSLTASHRQRLEEVEGRLRAAQDDSDRRAVSLEEQHNKNVQQLEEQHRKQLEESEAKTQAEINRLNNKIQELESQSTKSNDSTDKLRQLNEMLTKRVKERDTQLDAKQRDIQALEEDIEAHIVRARNLEDQVKDLKGQIKSLESRVQESSKGQTELQVQLNAKEDARSAAQTELDDLLMILGDMEEKRKGDKKKIKELGGSTSDDESDGNEAGGGSDEGSSGDEDEDVDEDEQPGKRAGGQRDAEDDSDADGEDETTSDSREDEGDDAEEDDKTQKANGYEKESEEAGEGSSGDDTSTLSSPNTEVKGHNRESSVD